MSKIGEKLISKDFILDEMLTLKMMGKDALDKLYGLEAEIIHLNSYITKSIERIERYYNIKENG